MSRLHLICLHLLGALVLGQISNANAQVRTPASEVFVTPAEAAILVENGAAFLDARSLEQYSSSHPAGAVHVDWQWFSDPAELGRLNDDLGELASRFRTLGVGFGPVVLIGDWDSGWGEEGRLFWTLEALGHSDAHIVAGGFGGWTSDGLPVHQQVEHAEPGDFSPRLDPDVVADLSRVEDWVANSNGQLIDVRSAAEFEGATPYGEARGGHIPGAQNVAWSRFFEGGELVGASTVVGFFGEARDTPITLYCTGGVRSAFVYAVLRSLGYEDVRNYAGSWWEYAASEPSAD
ncbi:MAG: sulfurtransferase [Myxococcales bacterium]|nr:sulfurtransferase [Myxococcales bacterium]